MDPWADSSAAWTPTESASKHLSPPSLPNREPPSRYSEGPVDPWAESNYVPISIPSYTNEDVVDDEGRKNEHRVGNDFDPWGGNAAPIGPLSRNFSRADDLNERTDKTVREEESSNRDCINAVSDDRIESELQGTEGDVAEEEQVVGDDDDPWGSGAAARKIKVQIDAEANAHRLEILRLQEEAKGTSTVKKKDDPSTTVIKSEERMREEEEDVQPAATTASVPAVSGWRSLFSKAATKANDTSSEVGSEKEKQKLDVSVAKTNIESKESPHSSTAISAPRLWQAPTILANHTRSTSSTSRGSSIVDTPSGIKGPGWEITTKKQQSSTSGGPGFIQSIFGSASTSSNVEDKTAITATKKEEKTGGLNRFGRGMQPPPVVSAADEEEDESFEASETGVEWDSSSVFDHHARKNDLLSDDAEVTATEGTLGKLLGKLRGRNAQMNEKQKTSNDMSKADLSWLENIGEGSHISAANATHKGSDIDWLAFIENKDIRTEKPGVTQISSQKPMTAQMVSNTSKGQTSVKIPALAPPPSNSRSGSPFTFAKINKGLANTSSLQSPPSKSSKQRSDFDEHLVEGVSSPDPNSGYRDDFTENQASLLNDRPAPTDRKTNSFLSSFQGRPSRGKYDYDETEEDNPEDNWTAFRDEPQIQQLYRDSNSARTDSSTEIQKNSSLTKKIQSNNISIPTSPSAPKRVQTWDRNGLLLAAPSGRRSPIGLVKQNNSPSESATPSPSSKAIPKTLSQGKTLTNDDLSFFESL